MLAFRRRLSILFVRLPWLRATWSALAAPFLRTPTLTMHTYAGGLSAPDGRSYTHLQRFFLSKRQTFEEYMSTLRTPKTYISLPSAAYFQVYNDKPATIAVLKSFRSFYPDTPVYLLSDGGDDFSDIATRFSCTYTYDSQNLGYRPCKNMLSWFNRLADACNAFPEAEWLLILEDDVRTRDRISRAPLAHLNGQDGTGSFFPRKRLAKAAREFLTQKFPDIEINGIGGCGGSLLHTESFLTALKGLAPGEWENAITLDPHIAGATDIGLTFLFLNAGYVVRRWFDLSEDSTGNYGPGAAFDHQFKTFYAQESDTALISSSL